MIDYITGKPRTGKTYRAMKYILDNFFDEDKTPPYKYILTNIGGFQYVYLNNKFAERGLDNKAYKLIWKDFLEHIKVMHKMAYDGSEDDELIDYANEHKINNALIVLDEAMLYLKKLDESISWFFSYHGHFKVRLIIMCQHPKQVHADYKIHTEFFIHAQPQSKQLTNSGLRYKHYDNPELKDSHSSDTIKTNPEVYKLYKSGEIDKPKKIIYKYIALLAFGFLFFVFMIYSLFDRLSPDNVSTDDNKTEYINDSYSSSRDYVSNSNEILLNIRCNEKNCWNTDTKYFDNSISLNYFKYIVIKYQLELNFEEIKNEIYTLKPFENALSKVTLAKLTDYYYFIPSELKTSELAILFKLKNQDIDNKPLFGDSFISNGETRND